MYNCLSSFFLYNRILIKYDSLNGVSVGNTYNVETIRSAIKKTFGANAKLDCKNGALTDVYLNFYVRGKDTYEVTEDYIAAGSCKDAVYFPPK